MFFPLFSCSFQVLQLHFSFVIHSQFLDKRYKIFISSYVRDANKIIEVVSKLFIWLLWITSWTDQHTLSANRKWTTTHCEEGRSYFRSSGFFFFFFLLHFRSVVVSISLMFRLPIRQNWVNTFGKLNKYYIGTHKHTHCMKYVQFSIGHSQSYLAYSQ